MSEEVCLLSREDLVRIAVAAGKLTDVDADALAVVKLEAEL